MELKNLRDLIEKGFVSPAKLPEGNEPLSDLSRLDKLDAYSLFFIEDDYPGSTSMMWNPLYKKLGMNVRNITLIAKKDNLRLVFDTLRRDPKYLGGSVGSGLKDVAKVYMDRVFPEWIGSVNSVVNTMGVLTGYNTDIAGFAHGLELKLRQVGKTIEGSSLMVIGAGGVAHDICRMLAEKGASRMIIANRTVGKAEEITKSLNEYGLKLVAAIGEPDIESYLFGPIKFDAIINLSRKGSPGTNAAEYAAFAVADEKNNQVSFNIAKRIAVEKPDLLVYDITAQKKGSKTKEICEQAGIKHFLGGVPMVVLQSVPTYFRIQEQYPNLYKKRLSEDEILTEFKSANPFSV